MSTGKAFLIDTILCTACRGCQIACKQWNQLPATTTSNWGSMQNPKDLSYDTYKLVRFHEHNGPENKPVWYFFSDQCRHCMEPSCKEAVDGEVSDGIIIDRQTGAVLFTDKLKKIDPDDVLNACPFDIPKAQEKTGLLAKCTMCVDRVHNGLLPACVKTCPTGAMNFGDRDKMVKMGKERLAEAKTRFPRATLTGLEDLRVLYLLADVPKMYYAYAEADLPPARMDRKTALRKIGRSLRELAGELDIYG